jgi:hypothetical protein
VKQIPVRIVETDNFSQLLQGPLRARMRRDIDTYQSPACAFNDHEHVEQSEARGHSNEEVTRQNRFCVVHQERCPRWSPRGCPGGGFGMDLRTVLGETRTPSFINNSLAMRSSPHSGFSAAIVRISARSSTGIGGRPSLHLNRQNNRQPARCQRRTVCGRTMTTALCEIEQARQQRQADPRRSINAPRLDPPLDGLGEMLSQDPVLGTDFR